MKATRVIFTTVATALVAGTTLFTSCEKEVNDNIPTLTEKNIAAPKFLFDVGCITMWWSYYSSTNPERMNLKAFKCDTAKGIKICGAILTPVAPQVAVARLSVSDGLIQKMIIQPTDMPSDEYNAYLNLVEDGKITFAENCPITDPKVLAEVKTGYIPAGDYPITMEGDNIVITISE